MNVTHWYHFIFSQTDELVRAQSACCNLTSPDLIWLLAQYFTDSQDTSTACLHKHNILFRIIFVCLLKNLHSEHLFACILFKLPPQQNKTAESRKRNISWKYLPYFICSWVCSWCLGMKDSFSFTRRGRMLCVPTLSDPSTGSGASGVLAAHLMIWATGYSSLPLYTHINSSDIRGGMCHYSKSFWEISIATNHRRKDSFFSSRNSQVSLNWRAYTHPFQRASLCHYHLDVSTSAQHML